MSKFSFLTFQRSISRKPLSNSKDLKKSTTMHSIEETRKIFSKFDDNGDGKISLDEYKQALKVLGGGAPSKNEAAQTFRAADTDGDGFIDTDEFIKVYDGDGGVNSADEIQAVFRVFDGDGKITAEELVEVLRRMGEKCSLDGCKKMIKGVDRDEDGMIDMDEFMSMMMQTMRNVWFVIITTASVPRKFYIWD